MKTKEQKRREAIERLEQAPRWEGRSPEPEGWHQEAWVKRLAEAKRLREKFGLTPAQRSEA